MSSLKNLRDVLVEELKDLYSAEKQLIKALPRMAAAATHEELKNAFIKHRDQTEGHVLRLDHIAKTLGFRPAGKKCHAMEGLIAEGREKLASSGDSSAKDASLISIAQKVEHYEIAGYGTVRTFAQLLGYEEATDLLQTTLNEEGVADKNLTVLAEAINIEAGIFTPALAETFG